VIAGFRPEDVSLANRPEPPDGLAALTVTAELLEPMGNEIVLYTRYRKSAIVARVNADELPETHADTLPEIGKAMQLWLKVKKIHYFDAASGKRL
jgi:multiple sugar transport system ATP-binding protein